MIGISMVHGIQAGLPPDWWQEWLHELRGAGLTRDVAVTPIEWEFERPGGWLPNLIGNLTAVMSPDVQKHVSTQLDRAAWLTRRCVVFAHSLGTVLAHQALVELGLSCDLFVTFGSPLWIADKYPQLWYPVSKPAGVLRWVNFYSPIDWLVGRRPIAAADLNIRTWNTHRALQYLRSPVLRAALPPVFEAVFDDDTPPAAPAIAA